MGERFLPPTEAEIREKIANEIMEIDISEGKQISPDWYAATIRMRQVASIVARGKNGSSIVNS